MIDYSMRGQRNGSKNVQTATQETEENIYLPKTADRTVQQGEQLENTFEVRDFNLFYGNFHALKNINLDILKQHITLLSAFRLW